MQDEFGIKGIVRIGSNLYAKDPEALSQLFEKMKKDPGNWFASIRDDVSVRKGKCRKCGAYIDLCGIRMHKHQCEACGAYTYLEFKEGSRIRFFFTGAKTRACGYYLRMLIFGYDEESRYLLLHAAPLGGDGFCDMDKQSAKEALEKNRDKYTRLEKDGWKLIAVPYDPYGSYDSEKAVINVREIRGSEVNYDTVKLYCGKEYGEYEKLPIAESYSINEAWRWAPLRPSPTLHESIISAVGMVSRCDYYCQDGRREFYDSHLERMRLFVEHFTALDLVAWDRMILYADKSDPGMIRAVANFCSDNPRIIDEPNIGNALHGLGKMIQGERLTREEARAMKMVVGSAERGGILRDFLKSFKRK